MMELNYSSKLGEVEQLLNSYSKRYLSLIGKVTVIKTLAIPKLVHLLSVLPSPAKAFIVNLENLFKNFLWNNKKRRVSYQQLCKEVEAGGLKLTHVETLICSLKIAWIKRLIETKGSWQDIFRRFITDDVEQIWELDSDSLEETSNIISNNFWKEVFKSWIKYRGCVAKEESVKDLIHANGGVLGYQDFKEKFKVEINFVDFYSLIHSLKPEWKRCCIENCTGEVKRCIEKLKMTKKVCKLVYACMIKHMKCVNLSLDKWQKLGIEASHEEWKQIYRIPFRATTEVKLQSFQYQILKRCLVTNKFLHMCKIKDTSTCQFCKREVETIEHLFFECNKVKQLWKDFAELLPRELNFKVCLNRKDILLGTVQENHNVLLNHILIIGKRYIYVNRCLDKPLNKYGMLRTLKKHYVIEMKIASMDEKKRLFKKWNVIKFFLDSV